MLTSPGLPVEPAVIALGAADASPLAAADASLLGAAEASALGAVLEVDEPQAPKTRAAAAMRTPRRPTVRSMPCLRFRLRGELSASDCTVALLLLRRDLIRTRPVRADDHPFHVVAGPVATDVRPPELHRPAVGTAGDAFDQERRASPPQAQQPGLTGAEQDRLEDLARPRDADAVALGQQVVERASLEIRSEQARKPFRRQGDLLEQERLAIGQAEPLEVERRRPELDVERRGDRLAGRLGSGRHEARLRIQAASLHLLGERQVPGEVPVDPGMEDERAATAGPLQASLADELAERPPDGDEAAAVADRQVALGREPVAGLPLARVEGGLEVQVDLVVERDRAELESETGHRRAGTSAEGRRLRGLRERRLLITL